MRDTVRALRRPVGALGREMNISVGSCRQGLIKGTVNRDGRKWSRPIAEGPRALVVGSLALLVVLVASAAERRPSAPGSKGSIPVGERLVFLVEWNPPWYLFFLPPMEAGEAEIIVSEETEYKGNKAIKIVFNARSSGALVKFAGIKIDDHFEFLTNPETLCTYTASKRQREGKRKRDIDVVYLPETRQLHIHEVDRAVEPPVVKKDLYRENIPECVKDLFSALYYARRHEFFIGAKYQSVVGDNDRIKEVQVRVERSEQVTTPLGRFPTWRLNTIALVGGLFKEGGQFRMWLTADDRKVPVQFEAKVSLGTISGKLKSGA